MGKKKNAKILFIPYWYGNGREKVKMSKKENAKIMCYGRNKYFLFHSFSVIGGPLFSQTSLCIYSKRIGEMAPIQFCGSHEDLIRLFENILSELWERVDPSTEEGKKVIANHVARKMLK
jgi:hypothetical protein